MKKYDKYYLKRDHSTGYVMAEDGKPVLDELVKSDCPLEERHVKILNRSWKNSGIYYAEAVNEPTEKEAKKLLRAGLFEDADKLLSEGKIEKAPAKNIKTEDLQKLINEHKGE